MSSGRRWRRRRRSAKRLVGVILFRAGCGQLKKLWKVEKQGVENNWDYEVFGLVTIPAKSYLYPYN